MASLIGTTIEWYDYFLFGTAAALVFNKLFFTSMSPAAGTLASLATFGVAFLARPLGAIIFGHFGDRVGRKTMLVISLLLMGVGTAAIGLFPTYDQVGLLAPALLVFARLLQGLAVGGEWGGAVLIAVENAPEGKRGLYGAAPQMGVPLGLMLGTGAFLVLSTSLSSEDFLSWGWRVPFLLSIALVIVGLYIRMQIEEAPAFAKLREEKRVARYPVAEVFRTHWRQIILGTMVQGTANVPFYVASVYILSYATVELGLDRNVLLTAVVVSAALDAAMMPVMCGLSDRFGRRAVMLAGSAFFGLYAFPFFWLVDTGSTAMVFAAMIPMFAIGHACCYGMVSSFLSELFDVRVRYSGTSVAYQLGGLLWSAPAPFVAAALFSWSGHSWVISLFILASVAITIPAVLSAPELSRKALDHDRTGLAASQPAVK